MSRQGTGKATLKVVARRKGGKTYYLARGSYPVRTEDGKVGSGRTERGFGPDITTSRQREAKVAEWNKEYEDRFNNPRKLITFAKAYSNYIRQNHQVPYYAELMLAFLGEMQCSEIDDSIMVELADDIWEEGASPKTINRHLYTPVISILHKTLKEKAPELQRPKGHREVRPVIIPPEEWYRAVATEMNPNQFAFVMCLAMHGRRTSEMLKRTPKHLNVELGTLDLGKTKTGIRQLDLHPGALKLLMLMPGWEKREWLFGAGPNSANSFRRDLRAACARAGQEWYTPHQFGRHTSVTRMLRAGYSTKHVADAHGMTEEMVARRYGHLTKKETTQALHAVGGALLDNVLFGGNEGEDLQVGQRPFQYRHLKQVKNLPASNPTGLLPSEGSTLSS